MHGINQMHLSKIASCNGALEASTPSKNEFPRARIYAQYRVGVSSRSLSSLRYYAAKSFEPFKLLFELPYSVTLRRARC